MVEETEQQSRPRALALLLELLALTGFAVVVPMLGVLGENPELFVFHDITDPQLVLFAIVLAFVPALILWAVDLVVMRIDRRAARVLHTGFLSVLAGITALQFVKWGLGQRGVVVVLAGLVGAGLFAFAYTSWSWLRTWTRYAAVLPALALAAFFLTSPTGDLLRAEQSVDAAQTSDELPSVVFVLLDEFPTKTLLDPAGDIDADRFPNLAGFAEDATWYRNYTASATATEQAVPSLLSGEEPRLAPLLWTAHPDTLFTLLAPTHDLAVHESISELCGLTTCHVGPPGTDSTEQSDVGGLVADTMDLWWDRIAPTGGDEVDLGDFAERLAPGPRTDSAVIPQSKAELELSTESIAQKPERQREFVDSLVPAEEPVLYFLHLVLPHSPFRLYANGQPYDMDLLPDVGHYPFTGDNDQGEWIAALTEQRHILQAEYTDQLVGEILDTLEEQDIYDDSLVIITADHGASFELGSGFRRADESLSSVSGVAFAPLLVKLPGQTEPAVDESNLMAIDLVPTIADLLGLELSWDADGVAAGSPEIEQRGNEKHISDFGDFTARHSREVFTFDSTEQRPSAGDRWIPSGVDDDALEGLLERLASRSLIGSTTDQLVTAGSEPVEARLADADRLLNPPADASVLGVATGVVPDAPKGSEVLVAVRGRVVSGSPLYDLDGNDDTFAALLPQGALEPGVDSDLELFLWNDGEVVPLRIED